MLPLSTIKTALRIGYDDDDTDLLRLSIAAQAFIERRTQLALSRRTEIVYLGDWVDITIPVAPFVSVSAVHYYDDANVQTTLAATGYWIDRSEGPLPVLRFLESPSRYRGTNIDVHVVAGYSQLPSELVHAMIALVGHWYNNPEAAQPVALATVPLSVDFILDNLSTRSNLR